LLVGLMQRNQIGSMKYALTSANKAGITFHKKMEANRTQSFSSTVD